MLFLKKRTVLLLRLLSKMMLLLELMRLNTKSDDLVSMLQNQISLEFLVLMLGYSIDNLPVSWYMLVEE